MNTTDLKPGEIVQHPEHGPGIVYIDANQMCVMHRSYLGRITASDLTGWERVETVRPGHVQVRVADLDLNLRVWAKANEANREDATIATIRVARAIAAQRAKRVYAAEKALDESRKHRNDVTIIVKIDKESIAQVVHDEIEKAIAEGRLYKVDND